MTRCFLRRSLEVAPVLDYRPRCKRWPQVRGKQRLAEREIEMDRPGRVAAGRLHGARCRRPCVTNESVVTNRNGHVDKPLHVAAKKLDLIDRLSCAPVP